MKSTLDSIMYGSAWATRDADGRRVNLYGPWYWVMTPTERRDFPWRDFSAVRRRTRSRASAAAHVAGMLFGAGLVAYALVVAVVIPTRGGPGNWIAAAIGVPITLLLGAHLLVSIPANPAKFKNAMVSERRCPSCAHRLEAAAHADDPMLCAECGSKWRIEPQRIDSPKTDEQEWLTSDDRGTRVRLFDAPALDAVAAQRLEISTRELKRLKSESSRFSRAQRFATVAFSGIIGLNALLQTIGYLGDGNPWMALFYGVLSIFCTLGFIASFRLSTGLNRDLFRAAMLRRGRCPRCAYRIERCPPDPADNCRVCPECGAAWRLPTSPPTPHA